ncbi:MAG: phosphomannose isomerase type II C-terminal cupin domain [Candidatus Omnitrophota bacterium]|nr:phosphomannose isomerase type II C-terminal cupin domain [Candidatus Omnitrophota bacterium]
MKVERPWGCYTVLNEGAGFKVKLVEVLPYKKLSLQKHKCRSEHWVVVEGQAQVANDGQTYCLKPNESIYISKNSVHRLENNEDTVLKIIEVQCGDYLEEDDIERLEDEYQRDSVERRA